jgi:general secretion pathway protein A
MYLEHFNLKTKPFTLSTDPRFLWAGAIQRQALSTLSYGLRENRGIVVLSGEFGTGKTTLVNAFVQSLDYTVRAAQLPEPGTDRTHFRRSVAEGFGIRTETPDLEALLEALTHLADDQQDYQGRLLLVIDEAQGLTAELQADVNRLACREYRDRRLLHILLVGQNDIYQWAASPSRDALIHQVSATCRLYPLSESETTAYISLRLRVAGAVRPIYEEAAISAIHSFSHGVPRAINLVCDFALLHAHLKGAETVDAEMVELCKDRFQMALLDTGTTPEVTVRDLATLTAEPPPTYSGWFRRRLGLAAPVLLLIFAVGFWYYQAVKHPPVNGDKADSVVSPTEESSLPPRPSSGPAPSGPPSIPAVEVQKAATLPFAEPRPPKQEASLKKERLPTEEIVDPQQTASKAGGAERAPKTAVNFPAEKHVKASTDAPVEAQRPPTETIADPRPAPKPALAVEEITKAADDARAGEPPQAPPSVATEQKPAKPSHARVAGNADSQDFTPPRAPASKSPTAADPGDIIDWLIQKKQTGGISQRQAPDETQPASD